MLNSAGRPIFSLHGDEQAQAGLTALIQALISVAQSQGDQLRCIRAGDATVVLLVRCAALVQLGRARCCCCCCCCTRCCSSLGARRMRGQAHAGRSAAASPAPRRARRGPIYLVAASRAGEPAAALHRQLQLLHAQLLLIVSSSVERALERNPGFDVRALLGSGAATLRLLASESFARSPAYLLEATEPLALAPADRRAAAEGLQEAVARGGALYGALLVGSRAVAVARGGELPPLHPHDLLLLATFVESTESLRVGECFTPICLPHWQPKGGRAARPPACLLPACLPGPA